MTWWSRDHLILDGWRQCLSILTDHGHDHLYQTCFTSLKMLEINQIFLSLLQGKIYQFIVFFIKKSDILYLKVGSSSSDLFPESLECIETSQPTLGPVGEPTDAPTCAEQLPLGVSFESVLKTRNLYDLGNCGYVLRLWHKCSAYCLQISSNPCILKGFLLHLLEWLVKTKRIEIQINQRSYVDKRILKVHVQSRTVFGDKRSVRTFNVEVPSELFLNSFLYQILTLGCVSSEFEQK